MVRGRIKKGLSIRKKPIVNGSEFQTEMVRHWLNWWHKSHHNSDLPHNTETTIEEREVANVGFEKYHDTLNAFKVKARAVYEMRLASQYASIIKL